LLLPDWATFPGAVRLRESPDTAIAIILFFAYPILGEVGSVPIVANYRRLKTVAMTWSWEMHFATTYNKINN